MSEMSAEWPPRSTLAVFDKMDEWSAWASGDPSTLIDRYASSSALRVRPSQRDGGLVGSLARMMWGRPPRAGVPDDRIHVPLASDIFQASADLLFAEPPTISTGKDTAAQDQINKYLDAGLINKLAESAEMGSALGGSYLRVQWDPDLYEHSFISSVDADRAIPKFRHGVLVGVTFWWVVASNGNQVRRHLEHHEKLPGRDGEGIIRHQLYEGSPDKLGRLISLADDESTRDLPVVEGDVIPTGSPGLSAFYIPNRTPNALWRHDPVGVNLGQSDIAKCEGPLDRLDRTFSNWMRDLEKAKGRIVVPDYLLNDNGPGRGSSFDIEQDIFTPVQASPDSDGKLDLEVVQFDFDPAKYLTTCQEIVETVLRSAGYSAQTFGEDESGNAITATEVTSRGRRSASTRDRKLRHWQPQLNALLVKMLATDTAQFNAPAAKTEELEVRFTKSAQESTLQLATTASVRARIELVHPDWAEDEIDDEEARIKEEFGLGSAADPLELGIEPPTDDQQQEPPNDGTQPPPEDQGDNPFA